MLEKIRTPPYSKTLNGNKQPGDPHWLAESKLIRDTIDS
jgi:hypothetical protein